MNTTVNTHEQQAIDFLNATETTFKAEFLKNDFHFDGDESKRDIYKITLKRGTRKYSFNFGQSISKSTKVKDKLNGREFTMSGKSAGNHSYKYLYPERFPKNKAEEIFGDFKLIKGTAPNAYDILACLQKYDAGSFEDFCGDFGYDTDSRSAKKTYKAVLKEYQIVCALWSDSEIEQLQEIQ
jgi:hypothetical protein